MKLEKIKLSGFKSFVDPTTIPINGNLTAIVGPNGCGKSNIIDAVRWVMGESSAKHLRGGNMADVIFNGSSGRKPVGMASVELIFNNIEGKLGGEYAQYDTIAIKRQVSRDGQSLFMLNGSRCRRKDITDLFLGTGLGSRSYAIIEQGTISRMVEAKPEELRVHIEEAAGISKYKERRHETETRMQHTRENLERLDDLREEVDKQLKHLQKQAEKAEKYTELKKQERQVKLELLAMRWNTYHQAAAQLENKLQNVAGEHNRLFMLLRELDSSVTGKRVEHKTQQQQLNTCQGDYYTLVAEVSSLEQTIKHNENSHRETELEISRTRQQINQLQDELEADSGALEAVKQDLLETEESLEVAEQQQEDALQQLQQIQQQRQEWQQQWDAYRTENAHYKEQAEVQRVKTVQLENQNRQLQTRLNKLQSEKEELSSGDLQSEIDSLDVGIELIEQQRQQLQEQLQTLQQQIQDQRQLVKHYHDKLHARRSEQHGVKGKITSLELLQQHAMGKDNKHLSAWLASVNINNNQRLAECLDVQPGWDNAVETVLGASLEAICINEIEPIIADLQRLADESLTLFATGRGTVTEPELQVKLLDKISAPWDLSALLGDVYCADDAQTASDLSARLKGRQSVITPEGIWFGPGWVKISRAKDSKTGVLQREKELRLLKQRQDDLQIEIATLEDQLDATETDLKAAESGRESLQQQDKGLGSEVALKNAQFSAQSARLEQQQRRLNQVGDEIADISRELAENIETIAEFRLLYEEAEQVMAEQEQKRQSLDALNQAHQSQYQQSERLVNESRQQVYGIKARIDSLHGSEAATTKQIARLQSQHQQAVERIVELEKKKHQAFAPLDDEKKQLAQMLIDKEQLEM
ncbi:MAG: chromosome segregation protein SMC, partial [Methylococcaceae bacterium]